MDPIEDALAGVERVSTLTTYAERLVPQITRVRGRVATVSTRAVTVRETIEVDVVHEELVVTYADAGDGRAAPSEPIEHRIALRAEEIVVSKRVRVVEEVVVSTRPVTTVERHTGVVRREEVVVESA